jgi:4-amino-4-deoxy-L-arabinose transferase-like glycosyltransferase
MVSTRQELGLAALAGLLMIGLGFWIAGDYGVSIDEPGHVRYAQQTLDVYAGRLPVDQYHVDLELNGPFYSLVAYDLGGLIADLRPGWSPYDGRHFVDYLSLVAATFFLWLLSRRYFRRSTAWLLAGAFFTQPILFGHAFINPKDTPFLAATLAGLTLGVQALPRPSPNGSEGKDRPIQWVLEARGRWTLITASLLGILLSAGLLFWSGLLPLAQKILESAYQGSGPAPINAAFRLLARNASSASSDAYLARLATWFDIIRLGAAAAAMFSLLLAWAISIRGFAEADTSARRRLAMAVAAGIAIGLATAIRSVAPLVLLPLAVLYVLELRRRSFTTGIVLVGTTIVTAVAAWPYLWQSPIRHYLDSLTILSHFPWRGDILFNGRLLDQGQQPWFYIPELIGLQITLPVLAFAAMGLAALWLRPPSRRSRLEIVAICATLLLPVLASLRPGTIVYNNFRQFLFTLPALFLLAGVGLEEARSRLRKRVQAALAVLILLPGIVGLIRLHPYEYIYYNALAGSPPGVYSRFESDYWCTSYREAMRWVNATAPPKTIVAVGSAGFTEQVTPFARPDLKIVRLGLDSGPSSASLAIVCDGHSGLLNLRPDARVLMSVNRAGAVLAQVKDLRATR